MIKKEPPRPNQTRLNPSTRVGTPNPTPYISSGLNPRTTTSQAAFNKLPIVEQVSKFEDILKELSANISLFKEDGLPSLVADLIAVNDDLRLKTTDLEKHRQLGDQIRQLQQQGDAYSLQSNHILKELIQCREQLKKLPRHSSEPLLDAADDKPRRPAAAVTQGLINNPPDMEEVLRYAMKLSKFTKAPPTMANMQNQIHPNNYIWPAEDALRRGMLAMVSLNPNEVINNELGVSDDPHPQVEPEEKPQENQVEEKPRRGSFGGYGGDAPAKEEKKEEDLDLDLFDPEDDFSD